MNDKVKEIINPAVLNDAKKCNAGLYKDGRKPRGKSNLFTSENGHGSHNIKPRTYQIIDLCNSGYTVDQIHERVGGTKSSVRECLKRHNQEITDRGGSFYDIRISGKDFDRIMRSLESYKRNVSHEECNKAAAMQMKLRQFEKHFDFDD